MGDVGDEYRETRAALQDRRWDIVANRFDFWGTKGLWIERKTKRRGHGVQTLVAELLKEGEGV